MKQSKRYALPADFESRESASQRATNVINALDRLATSEAIKLADKLSTCCSGSRCGSAACPLCNRLFRKRLHREALEAMPPDAGLFMMSLIPATSRVEVGQLWGVDLKTWTISRQRGIARALPAEALFFGGVDISLNTFENGDPHWCLHLYGFLGLPPTYDVLKRAVRDSIRASIQRHCPLVHGENVGVPLKLGVRNRADLEATLLYCHKAQFYRRSRYGDLKWKTGKRSTNVRGQPLRSAELAELSLFLDRFPLGSRMMLKGFRRRGLRGGLGRFTLFREVNW